MTGGLVQPTALQWPLLAEAITLSACAGLSFVLFWFSRGMQQKVAILNTLAAVCAAAGLWVLYTNGAIYTRDDDARSFFGRWLGYAPAFGFLAASFGTTLILHNWAKEIMILAGVALPIDALFISLASSNGAQVVLIVLGLLAFVVMSYLLLLNTTRQDWLGMLLVGVTLFMVLVYGVVLLLGPEFLGSQMSGLRGFTEELYAWIFFALAIVQFGVLPFFSWVFVEDERTYCARKGLPMHEHLSTGDGTSLAVLPTAGVV